MHLLPDRLPWFVAGPLLGLCVVALYALANKPLGATSVYADAMSFARDRAKGERWRLWYFVGLVAGAMLVTELRGGLSPRLDYGALGAVLPVALLVPVLYVGGILLGYGGRWGGGCTSGHGLRGMSELSPASIVAGFTFFATAIAIAWLLQLATRGAL